MTESNDNKLKEVFGSLSKAKAAVPHSCWNTINSQIKKPGFWSSSLYHFNYIYVLCGSLLLSTGIILWNNGTEAKPEIKSSIVIEEDKTNNTSYSSKVLDAQKAEPTNKANSNITSTKKEITESVDDGSTENMTNSKQPLNEAIINTSSTTDTIKEIALIADTTNYSDIKNVNSSRQTLDEATTQTATDNEKNTLDTSDSKQEKDSIKTTTTKSTGKQIIIIDEEETVIQTDTVHKKKRYKRKHD